jgi:putative transposase
MIEPLFTQAWTQFLESGGVTCVPIPANSPNCNPYPERFVRTVRTESLDHFVIFGERHLRYLLAEFLVHYLSERYHQGLDSKLIRPEYSPANNNMPLGAIQRRSRLGGQLNSYFRNVA